MSATAILTAPRKIGDVIKSIFHPGFNYESGLLENHLVAAIALTDPVGQPVKKVAGKWRFVQAADEANTGGLLVHQQPIDLAAGATHADKFLILMKGPALINKDKIATTDSAGAALTNATIVTALAALNIVAQSEPTIKATQTL